MVGFGDLHNHGPRVETPSNWTEWNRTDGSDTESSHLNIYSKGLPTNIFYATGRMVCIEITDCKDLHVKFNSIHHAGIGIRVSRSNNVTITGDVHHSGIGVRIKDSTNVSVRGCRVTSANGAGIFTSGDCRGLNISGNSLAHCGLSESSASIYCGHTTGPGKIRENHIHDQKYGNWWDWDGSGIYTDSGTSGMLVEHNKITESYLALQDNSGSPGNVFTANTIVLCDYGMDITDSKKIGKATTRYYGNVLINCMNQGGPRYTQGSGNMLVRI